ncbi:MAG TPA: nitroreductase family protein [Caldithrix abyssi]|uniref:Nitroreductase family protein n=1 Tax=Caldithrix abyssi TaxID=187145 RepID=A0A7V5LIW0_CALAY|nr:nitroreductase family protein [Caldithrix abyssi]
MMIRELILKNRSCRRFQQNEKISRETLRQLVDLARLSASASNLQPLKYIISGDARINAKIFPTLAWAGYLTDWPGPAEGERPAAYIIILGDKFIKYPIDCDHGIAAQSILLGATEMGYAGCIIGSVKREELRKILEIPDHLAILLVLALGKPAEKIVLDEVGENGDIRYWRDENGVHHVPKRKLEDIIVQEY